MEELICRIESTLLAVKDENERLISKLTDSVRLTDYVPQNGVWTAALQAALKEHSTVIIPGNTEPYMLDGTVTLPSNCRIIAEEGAVMRLTDTTKVLMLRNENTADGTHKPISDIPRSENISIIGGTWEEYHTTRGGYGESGLYDENRSFYGVSACMLFNNINHLTLRNMTFKNCGGFGVQVGEACNVIVDNITFENCFADGVHINGNIENVHVSSISGEVGDDLVAFNLYDWQDSSVNFGPGKCIICEDITPAPTSRYKALRLLPGIYTFDDGSTVDCALTEAVFRRIKNIITYKLYCQTPAYNDFSRAEKASVGSSSNIVFDDIEVDLYEPIDLLPEYLNSDPVKGSIAAFELGANIDDIYFRNISLKLHRDKYPYSYLICIGPKSVRMGDTEVFDPYLSSHAERVHLKNISVNGAKLTEPRSVIREITFESLYSDMPSTGRGTIGEIICR